MGHSLARQVRPALPALAQHGHPLNRLSFPQPLADPPHAPTIRWADIRDFQIEGQGWANPNAPFDRLPASAEALVRPPVWDLSHHSAGILVRFTTDAPTSRARWTLRNTRLAMPHMPANQRQRPRSLRETRRHLALGRQRPARESHQ